jgi:peptide/nickel transport system substrate-binding protein
MMAGSFRRTTRALAVGLFATALGAAALPGAVVAQASDATIENVKIAGAGPVQTLDITKAGDLYSVDTVMLTQGTLFRHDAAGVLQPELAESISQTDDGMTVTVKLKPGLTYSDGTPVTAEDIKVAYDRVSGEGPNRSFIVSIKDVEVLDDLTAQINMNYPDPDLLHGLSARALALNPAAAVAADPDYFLHPVSAGPYMVTEFTPGKSIHLAENPTYVGGPMVVKGIDIEYVPDLTSRVLQLATGALDLVWDLPIAAKDSLPPEVRQFTVNVGGMNVLRLNQDPAGKAGAKFADPRVREAMSLAIDRQAIADIAFAGLVKPMTSFWRCPDICPEGTLPNGGVQDVEAAKKLMADAGVTSIDAELLVSSTRPGWKEAATLVASDLAEIGVNLAVTPVDEATWLGALNTTKNFEAVFAGSASHAQGAMDFYVGNGLAATNDGYILVPDHDKVADLVTQMAQELDPVKRADLMAQVQAFARETMPNIPLVDRIALVGTHLPEGVVAVPATGTPGYLIFQTAAEQAAGKGAGEP